VYTNQYGWLFMPYAQSYTYVPVDTEVAYMYVYDPSLGWTWLYAPWIFGFGPTPYWGSYGRVHFSWYAHPWFSVGAAHRVGSVRGPAARSAAFGHMRAGRGRR
jgi:hypothetical protein